ncbi:uncharacterized protein LOC122506287 [Leptopilina heterotoma]|uniref:uncharacterized protein LOC122506287 n=1 Tax=Leptopilina heterotoma TaxID=63436 RepID=UPI001CA87681|nr:uncharacterized protein LOC122506287 [Leptopilina heterotoma]
MSSLPQLLQNLQVDINYVEKWAKNNGLALNSGKTRAMIFSTSNSPTKEYLTTLPPLIAGGIPIAFTDTVKDLGITLDRSLTWKEHVLGISRKTYIILQQLNRNRESIPTSTRSLLVKTLILPIFDYCCVVYDDITKELNYKLERSLNACIRFIYGLPKFEHITAYRIETGLLSVAILTISETKSPVVGTRRQDWETPLSNLNIFHKEIG